MSSESKKKEDVGKKYLFPQAAHGEEWVYVGTIYTVCKAIDKADDVKVTESTRLELKREPENAHDSNATRVMVADSKLSTGYLPKNLARCLVEFLVSPANVRVDCVPLGRGPNTLSAKLNRDSWFDLQLDFWVRSTCDQYEKLKSSLQACIATVSGNVELRT